MLIEFSIGKIITTSHEVVIKLTGDNMVTLQSQIDALTLLGNGANVVLAHGAENKWSIKLDNQEQLEILAQQLCIAIK